LFSFIQSIHIKNIFKILQPSGKVYFGRDAGFLRTRYYAFAAVSGNGKVMDAKLLKASRIITLPKVESLDHLINQELKSLEPSSLGLDDHVGLAVQNLVVNYKKLEK
jgi:hypothetical protein